MCQIYLTKVRCDEETDEVGSDEPYVLVTAVNLAARVNVGGFPVPIPAYEVVRYGPFGDVDKGETHFAPGISQSFWSLTNTSEELNDPDNVIFIVSLMENDSGDPEVLRGIVKGIIGGSIFGSLSFQRRDQVDKLINDINSVLRTPTGAPNFDDKVGIPQELQFSKEELTKAESGHTVSKTLEFSGDGGHYTLTFEAGLEWQKLDDNSDSIDIVADGNYLYQMHKNGRIWKCLGSFRNWQELDNNSATKKIAAGGGHLYKIHKDGSIWKYTGQPMTVWQRLNIDSASIDSVSANIVAASNHLYQIHKNGFIWKYIG